jgi:hypothetical protein
MHLLSNFTVKIQHEIKMQEKTPTDGKKKKQ